MPYTYHGIIIAVYNRREDLSLEQFCDWMLYCTHQSDMDAPDYVHVDVHSDYFCHWMFYYTYHSYMDAPQYVHADVPSDYLC